MYVLIDDDHLIHELWKFSAKTSGVELSCFSSVDDFLKNKNSIPEDSQVYVDSNLEGVRGEDQVWQIKAAGYDKIFIATGYSARDINTPDFVSGVVGKRPPF